MLVCLACLFMHVGPVLQEPGHHRFLQGRTQLRGVVHGLMNYIDAKAKYHHGFLQVTAQESYHGLMNYKDTKAKGRHLKKLTCKGTLRQVFISLIPPPPVTHCIRTCTYSNKSVLRIHEILVWIRMRIRIRRSIPLN
jgi:hypothetical protein